ncbi:nuclear transcription factor Y subunit alpha-like isoform X2 [Cydia fagiglandana]|uniref:nuclear transcription factor Y subunit alpha-like isoform X2 n=1 Tax=Cydia fagiglandana TaxID=1458189 RepID=UPI002FEE1AD6
MSEQRLKRKKLTLTLKIKNEIINRIDAGETYSQLSREFNIGRSTIYDIYKNRHNIETAAKLPYKSERKTLRSAENPELEEKLYQWYLEEKSLYAMTGSLIILKARTLHKEMTGKDDFMASTGWLDRFKKRRGIVLGGIKGGSSSRPETPPPVRDPLPEPVPGPAAEDGQVEKTKGEQLVIRVTDNMNSKRNVFNTFTINDGHFENVIVKEERLGGDYQPEEQEMEPTEDEVDEPHDQEEMFPQPEAILGGMDEVMEEKNSVIRDLNDTLRKFLTEYKTRNALMRERIDLERARLQFDMEVYRNRQMEKRVIAVNAANAANVINAASAANAMNTNAANIMNVNSANVINAANAANFMNAASAASVMTTNAAVMNNAGNVSNNTITVGNAGNVNNANVRTVNASKAEKTANVTTANNVVNVTSVSNASNVTTVAAASSNAASTSKANPIITMNPTNTANTGNANNNRPSNPVMTLNPITSRKFGNTGISVKIGNSGVENTSNVAANSPNAANVKNVDNTNITNTESSGKTDDDSNVKIEDAMDET